MLAVVLYAVTTLGFIAATYAHIPTPPLATPPIKVPSLPPPILLASNSWHVFQPGTNSAVSQSSLRLAGTFLAFSEDSTNQQRQAIIADETQGSQNIVAEKAYIAGLLVASIGHDYVVLRNNQGQELRLGMDYTNNSAKANNQLAGAPQPTRTAISTNRFGQRIEDTRWVLQRQALQEYYDELVNDPVRLLTVYDALRPEYDGGKEVNGYKVAMSGEQEFFKAMGLQEGDVIRKVNSMRMVSQTRGEYFLNQVAQGKLDAIVIDIERDNKATKLVYQFK